MAPTNLLGARPDLGRDRPTPRARLIRALSARGILFGTVDSAPQSALYAATAPGAAGGRLYGPSGVGHFAGPPAEQKLYSRLRDAEDARRLWTVTEELTGVRFPATETTASA